MWHAEPMPRLLAAAVLVVGLVVVVWAVTRIGDESNGAAEVAATVATVPVIDTPVPILADGFQPLTELDGWLQADFDSLDDLHGQVVVVQFWTFGCINCKRTLDNLADMYAMYHDEGLEIVGVHAPEFDYERDVENIAAAAADLGVVWPIALDTEKTNFRAWQGSRRYWPRTYVIDQQGRLRYDHIGEGKYEELQATVAYLLNEAA